MSPAKVWVFLRAAQDMLAIFSRTSLECVNTKELYKIVTEVTQGHFLRPAVLVGLFGQYVDILLFVHDAQNFMCSIIG